MKLLIVWHAGAVQTYWDRYTELAKEFEEVKVLVPDKWIEGGKMVEAETQKLMENCSIQASKVLFSKHDATHVYVNGLYSVMNSYKPDVILIHEEPWALSTYQVMTLNKLLNINAKIVIDSAATTFIKKPVPFSLIEQYVYKNADLFFARNKIVSDVLKKRGCKVPVYILPNGVDTSRFKKISTNEVFELQKNLEIANNDRVIGFIGRMITEKGIYDFIDAAELLIQRNIPNLKFLMIGTGHELQNVKEYIKEKNLDTYFIIKEKMKPEVVPFLMNLIHILVLPSRTTKNWKEQFGRVLVEAMACEKAVLGSDSGGIPEVVNDEKFIFPEGDFASMADKIMSLVQDPVLYQESVNQNIRQVKNKFSWQALAVYMSSIFVKEDIITSKKVTSNQ